MSHIDIDREPTAGHGRPLSFVHLAVVATSRAGYRIAIRSGGPIIVFVILFVASRLFSLLLDFGGGARALGRPTVPQTA